MAAGYRSLLVASLIFIAGCRSVETKHTESIIKTDTLLFIHESANNEDSLAIIGLTKRLYEWHEERSKGYDFYPIETSEADTMYYGLDMQKHKKRMQELKSTGLFTQNFLDNYNQLALIINDKLRDSTLQWNAGYLPPFGSGADPWCDCQDTPDDYLNKIIILRQQSKRDTIVYDWGWGDGSSYTISAVKENSSWKIDRLAGFDITNFGMDSTGVNGAWVNSLIELRIDEEMLTFIYHGQCMYFYPIRKLDDKEFEMIWTRDMDCTFDNGTGKTFGLKKVPLAGQPFAKFILKKNVLHADYYFKEWVEKYSEEINADVFTKEYIKKRVGL